MPRGKKQLPGTVINHVQAFQQGEEEAYDYFFRQYFPLLVLFARAYLPEDAEDIVQECFTRLWEKHAVMKNPESIKSFLYTTVRNECLVTLRRKKRGACSLKESVISMHNPHGEPAELFLDAIIHAEFVQELYSAAAALPTQIKKVFQLTYIEGKSDAEASEILNSSAYTVRNQRRRAVEILKKKVNPRPLKGRDPQVPEGET